MKNLSILFFLLLFFSFFCLAQEESYVCIDAKKQYLETSTRLIAERSWTVENLLREKYVVLFIPGFLSNSFTETFLEYCLKMDLPESVKIGLKQFLPEKIKQLRLGDYYHDQIQFLNGLGIEAYLLKFESEADPQVNAVDILRQIMILTHKKKAILVTHSKGGVDTGVALCAWMQIQLNMAQDVTSLNAQDVNLLVKVRELIAPQGILVKMEERVGAWIAEESAFRGSPIADAVVEKNVILSTLAYGLLKFLGGNEKSLKSLVQSVRKEWIEKNKLYLHNVVQTISILSVSAYKKNPDGIYSLGEAILKFKVKEYFDTFLAPVRNFMQNQGIESDGLVPWKNAIIDGSQYLLFDSMDHAAPVMDNLVANIDRIAFLKTLLQMILERQMIEK